MTTAVAPWAKNSLVSISNNRAVTTSKLVADRFGKRHDHVLRTIRSLILQDERCLPNFGEASRQVAQPRGGSMTYKEYEITRDGFTLLAMGFTGERALQFKLAYIEAFNKMEAELTRIAAKSAQAPQRPPQVLAKPVPKFRTRDDLSMTKRDPKTGILINWAVEQKTDSWHEGVFIGEQWFDEVVQLAMVDPKAAYAALFTAGPSVLRYEGQGHEQGFLGMMARYAIAGILQGRGQLALPFKPLELATRDPEAKVRYGLRRV